MSERWLIELRKIGRMEPSSDLLARAESLPSLPEPGPSPAARVRIAVVALLVAAVGSWGAFAALNGAGVVEHQAGGSNEAFSALWPETSFAAAQQVQERVDAGDPEVQWRIDPVSVAFRYGQVVLGWSNPIAGLTVTDDPTHTVTVSLAGPDASCQGSECDSPGPQSIMTITLQRLVRSDEGGIWSVTAVSA